MRITFLGTGTSVGVPAIGCGCAVCTSEDPRNNRLRQSLWIRNGSRSLLVDTSVDLRQQALTYGIDRLDAVLLTHPHADHIFGLDETRLYAYHQRQTIPVYGTRWTLDGVRKSFWYAFEDVPEGGGRPKLDLIEIDGPFREAGLDIIPVEIDHGSMPVTGYRIGGLAYLTDCKRIPEETIRAVRGIPFLIINALRHEPPHPTHMTVGEALEAVEAIGPGRTFLTHMGHDLEYVELARFLPESVEPAYDGLTLDLD